MTGDRHSVLKFYLGSPITFIQIHPKVLMFKFSEHCVSNHGLIGRTSRMLNMHGQI